MHAVSCLRRAFSGTVPGLGDIHGTSLSGVSRGFQVMPRALLGVPIGTVLSRKVEEMGPVRLLSHSSWTETLQLAQAVPAELQLELRTSSGPAGPTGQSRWGGREGLASHQLRRSWGFSRKTKLKCFILLLFGLTPPLHGGKCQAKDPLQDNGHVQDVVLLTV